MIYKEGKGGEAGFDGKDRDWGRGEAVGNPSLGPSPEGIELVLHLQARGEEVCSVQKHWGDEGGGKAMAEERREAFPRGGQALDCFKGPLGEGQSPGEVRVSGEGGGKPVAEPPDFILRGEVEVVQSYSRFRGGGAFLGGAPVYELGFGNRKG